MMSVNDKKLIYIILAFFVCLAVIIAIATKSMFSKLAVKAPSKPVEAAAVRQAVPQVRAETLKAKTTETPSGKMPDDLEEMYRVYPEEDVGDNMVAVWSRLGAEEKEEFIEVLNKQIEAASDTLKAAPDDEKAKRLLFISEMLKKLAMGNFNYRIKPSIQKREEKLPQS